MKKKSKIFYGWWIVAGCFLLALTGIGISINCVSVFFKPVVESLGFTRGDFSFYFTISALSMMLAAPFMGKILTKYNIRVVMTICTILLTASFLMYSRCTTLLQFYLCSVGVGIGSAGTHVIPVSLLLTNWFKKKRGLAFGIALSGSGIGGLIFNPLTNWIITTYSWQNAYIVLGCILGITTIPVALFIVTLHPSHKGLRAYGESEEDATSMENMPGLTLPEAVKTSGFWLLGLVLFITGLMNMGIQMHIPAYLTDVGYSSTFAANIVALFMGVLVVGKLTLGSICDRFGMRTGLIYVYGIFAVAALSMLGAHALWMVIFFGIIFGMANAIMTVPPPMMTAEVVGSKSYGVIYGVMNIFFTLGCAIGMPLSGYIYDSQGSYTLAWNLYAVLALVGMVIALLALARGRARLAA